MALIPRLRDKTSLDRPPMARPKKSRIGEISTSWANTFAGVFRRRGLWPSAPQYQSGSTCLTYALARALYRNDNKASNLGAGFGKRIVNSIVDFTDLPMAASGDEVVDEFLNNAIHNYWSAPIQQFIRDLCRDADSVIRVRRHDTNNKLVAVDEWESCYLEIVPPETVAIYYKENGDNLEIDVAYIRHEITHVEERANDTGATLMQPTLRNHVLIEELTADRFRYYDETTGEWRDDLEQPNSWGFVPLVEGFNEYDAVLKGGQSEFESPLPFIMAFHDVVSQTLVAHKAHSIPKAKFKVHDMMNFIASNWPEAFDLDETGLPMLDTFNGQISWKGTEMLFFDAEGEDAEFLEVKSALGDSKELLDFLLTCISISSETPKSILMDQTVQDADEMVPFSKKINRKRKYFSDPLQMVCKMVLAINYMEPVRVPLSWEEITPDIALKKSQALQQDVMSFETLATRQVISDGTIRRSLRRSIPAMKAGTQEASDAKKNVDLTPTAPAVTGGASGAPVSTGSTKGTDSGNTKVPGNQN
jgi:hypothetical protein